MNRKVFGSVVAIALFGFVGAFASDDGGKEGVGVAGGDGGHEGGGRVIVMDVRTFADGGSGVGSGRTDVTIGRNFDTYVDGGGGSSGGGGGRINGDSDLDTFADDGGDSSGG